MCLCVCLTVNVHLCVLAQSNCSNLQYSQHALEIASSHNLTFGSACLFAYRGFPTRIVYLYNDI